jgi:cyclopropane-fatty-acyl-phospholipid synthase
MRDLRAPGRDTRATTFAILDELFRGYSPRDFAVRLWDGSTMEPDPGEPARFTLVLAHPGALRAMSATSEPVEVALGHAYLDGDLDIEGDVEAVFPLVEFLLGERKLTRLDRLRLARRVRALPAANGNGSSPALRLGGPRLSLTRARRAISYHYDLPPDFYRLFLDRRMTYSCAYYASEDDDLDTAQERKLDYVCRKLRLEPGQRLLDIGCGWGALILYAAERYGVEAVAITLSEVQASMARERIAAAGLADRCRVEVMDYREVDEPESFDKVSSIGMVEHVAEEGLVEYFSCAWRALRPGGVFLNHGIAQPVTVPRGRPSFTTAYVFPDTDIVPLSTTLEAAETVGWEVRDVESLREHYVLMTREWRRRLEANEERARELAGDVIYRAWRMGAAGVAHRMEIGRLSVFQTLLSKPDDGRAGLPLTRADWYR